MQLILSAKLQSADLDAGKHSSCGNTEVKVADHLSSWKSVNILQLSLWQVVCVVHSRP